MDLKKAVLALGLLAASSGLGMAQSSDHRPPLDDGRYSVTKLENGYLRLDKETGDLTHCVIDEHDAWNCVIVPETRAKYQKTIVDLKAENKYLKAKQEAMATRLVDLEETMIELRDRIAADAKTKDPTNDEPLVSKEERKRLDEALDKTDEMLRRFGAMLRGLKDDAADLAKKVPNILD